MCGSAWALLGPCIINLASKKNFPTPNAQRAQMVYISLAKQSLDAQAQTNVVKDGEFGLSSIDVFSVGMPLRLRKRSRHQGRLTHDAMTQDI